MEDHLVCGILFRPADLDLMFSDRLNQDERTTTCWRNGYPSTTSVCTSIHGPISSDILVLSVWRTIWLVVAPWSVCVGCRRVASAGGPEWGQHWRRHTRIMDRFAHE